MAVATAASSPKMANVACERKERSEAQHSERGGDRKILREEVVTVRVLL